jgi:hypothetical protein
MLPYLITLVAAAYMALGKEQDARIQRSGSPRQRFRLEGDRVDGKKHCHGGPGNRTEGEVTTAQ